ncbi:MAG: winged helix-turn-helix transcriptional regulator [Deltaproteobacteria bacterium]|nr:winged helix-turn-helix transcriptional regulator [Deltaproteobacteria bacterium]
MTELEKITPDELEVDTETLAQWCKAIGHPARVRIIKYLQEVNRCFCGNIVDQLPLAQSTVSQHLKSLKEAGLIRGEVEGPATCYCIDRNVLNQFKVMINKLCEMEPL